MEESPQHHDGFVQAIVMLLEKSDYYILPDIYDDTELWKRIELIGRVCWRSEDKITPDSYKEFCERLKTKNHLSVLRHYPVYLSIPVIPITFEHRHKLEGNKYSFCLLENNVLHVSTNMQVIYESDMMDIMQYQVIPDEHHVKYHTVKFRVSRAVGYEMIRHTTLYPTQESTRCCNYNKLGLSFIIPVWIMDKYGDNHDKVMESFSDITLHCDQEDVKFWDWINTMQHCERDYNDLIKSGCSRQEASDALNNAFATTLYMTGTEEAWQHFFDLRDANGVKPEMRFIAKPLHEDFIRLNYVR